MLMKGTFSFITLTASANILSGQVYEWLPVDCMIEVGLIQSATGLIASIACDSDIVLQDVGQTNITIKATPPLYPDDFMSPFACAAGSHLFVAIRNPTAGTLTGFYEIRINAI